MAQAILTPKRISALTPIDAPTDESLFDNRAAANWVMAIDSIQRSNAADRPEGSGLVEGTDKGSLKLPMSRIALRDNNGLIPATMLPGHIDDMMFGTFDFSGSTKVTFTEVVNGVPTGRVYVSPSTERAEGQYAPAENIIYHDNTTNLQYRFIQNEETTAPKFGFAEIPGSRALTEGYGVTITTPSPTVQNATEIRANYPQTIRSYSKTISTLTIATISAATPSHWITQDPTFTDKTGHGMGDPSLHDYLTITPTDNTASSGDPVVIGNVHEKVLYRLNLELDVIPVTQSAMIVDVELIELTPTDTISVGKCQMDMSTYLDPNGTIASNMENNAVTLKFAYLWCWQGTPNDPKVARFKIKTGADIRVLTKQFSFVELL